MSVHVVSVRTNVLIFVSLVGLLVLSVVAAQFGAGAWHLWTGVTIAAVKATLILLFFMHIKYDHAVTRCAALAGLLWLAILMSLTLTDYWHRLSDAAG